MMLHLNNMETKAYKFFSFLRSNIQPLRAHEMNSRVKSTLSMKCIFKGGLYELILFENL